MGHWSDKQSASMCWAGALFASVLVIAMAASQVAMAWAEVERQKNESGRWYWTTAEMLAKHRNETAEWYAIRFTGN